MSEGLRFRGFKDSMWFLGLVSKKEAHDLVEALVFWDALGPDSKKAFMALLEARSREGKEDQ